MQNIKLGKTAASPPLQTEILQSYFHFFLIRSPFSMHAKTHSCALEYLTSGRQKLALGAHQLILDFTFRLLPGFLKMFYFPQAFCSTSIHLHSTQNLSRTAISIYKTQQSIFHHSPTLQMQRELGKLGKQRSQKSLTCKAF